MFTWEEADRLALAHMRVMRWVHSGGKKEDMSSVAQELSYALYLIGRDSEAEARDVSMLSGHAKLAPTRGARRRLALAAMDMNGGSARAAAEALGVSRYTIYRAIKGK